VVLNAGLVQPTDGSGIFDAQCPAGKRVLGGGVAVFNKNIHVTVAAPSDDGKTFSVRVYPFTGSTFGGSGASAVHIRFTCATVSGP